MSQDKEEVSNIKFQPISFYKDKVPCLLLDTYKNSQAYLVLFHVWKVERALLLIAAEEPSYAPSYAHELFTSRGVFPFLMRQGTAIGVGPQRKAVLYSSSSMYNQKSST